MKIFWKWVLPVYAVLLIASKLWTTFHRSPDPLPPDLYVQRLPAQSAAGPIPGEISLAYRDTAPNRADLPVVLLIHGSPGSHDVMERLLGLLPADQFRFIVPDMPGFGHSTHDLKDYSFRAHGRYLIELLDRLRIAKAQLVGFSMGGAVQLSFYDLAPARVQSLVMLSAIGVQEHEWFGNYQANHLLHGAQLVALWLLREATPHFGLLDHVDLNVEYARNFFDSDQRPLRAVLERYRGPMLIIHGRKDPLVPLAAAEEHHRIVKQSEFLLFDNENHFMTFMKPQILSARLTEFLSRNRNR